MYGWRAKIGVVVPSNNTVLEPEFAQIAPEGVTTYAARMLTSSTTGEGIEEMETNARRAVRELHAGGLDVITYACLATSLVMGRGWSEDFIAQTKENTGLPATTAATASIEGLKAVKARRVALATPYPKDINALVQPFFESYGLEVVSIGNLPVDDHLEVCRIPPGVAYRLARQSDRPEADAICILATDFQTIPIMADLEKDIGKPAVSTNQALMWRSLGLAGVKTEVTSFSSLFAKSPPDQGVE
jgi:maleate cis-trans isomerase